MKYKDLSFPIVPYLEIEIAGEIFNCMDFISEAEIELIGDSTAKADIVLYDPTALEIEQLLLKDRKIKFHFGIVDSKGKLYKETFTGEALKYTPNFKPEGIGISINTIMEEFIKIKQKDKQRSFNDEISNIIKQIAEENGLKADIDKTDSKGIFRQINQTDYDFIKKVLQPKAYSSKNDSPFYFWIENETLFFKQIKTNKPEFKFILPDSSDSTAPVISFRPSIDIIAGMLAGEKVKVKKLDPLNKKYTEEIIDNFAMNKRVITGEKRIKANSERIRVAAHGNTQIEEIARYKRMWGSLTDFSIKAELEILGHPFIKPFKNAEIIMYLIDQKTKEIKLHYTSGIYTILKVKHSISSGSFKTTLEMVKNGALKGQEQAKGILNKQVS